MSADNIHFDGEYWNTNLKKCSMTRFRFTKRNERYFVSAWGRCKPDECEWGKTELFPLTAVKKTRVARAFAQWKFGSDAVYMLFKIQKGELVVESYYILRVSRFYQKESFKIDASQSLKGYSFFQYTHMWDGSELGWKLVKYEEPVYLVEFRYQKISISKAKLTIPRGFTSLKRVRSLTGVLLTEPLRKQKLDALKALQRKHGIELFIQRIASGDPLVLTPKGHHFPWVEGPRKRRSVIAQMIAAGVPILHRTFP